MVSYGVVVEVIMEVVAVNGEGKKAWIDVVIFIKVMQWF